MPALYLSILVANKNYRAQGMVSRAGKEPVFNYPRNAVDFSFHCDRVHRFFKVYVQQ
jgi:hypothetical protein